MSHKCHARNCQRECAPESLMCADHWRKLPASIQRRVKAEYVPGQCRNSPTPTEHWHTAADLAIYWIYAAELRKCVEFAHSKLSGEDKEALKQMANGRYTRAEQVKV